MSRSLGLLIAVALLLTPTGAHAFSIASSAFKDGAAIPETYSCPATSNDFARPSFPLSWSEAPQGTTSFVLLIDDPHPVAQYWVHWLVTDIPASVTSLAAGATTHLAAPMKEHKSSTGEPRYCPPCPPPGSGVHTYRVQLFAFDAKHPVPALPAEARGDKLSALLKTHAIGVAELKGTYVR